MDEAGVKITGFFVSFEEKQGEYDGQKKISYRYMVVAGMESYVVSSDRDYRESLTINDLVTFSVKPRCYGGKIFYQNGRLVMV